MSKERLEEIEKNLDPLGYGMGGHLINVNDIYWLVKYARKQSERVEELESRITDDEHFVAEILEQNRRYREVINQIKNNIPLEFKHISEYEAKKNVIRLINIDNLVNEYLGGEE